MQVYLALFSMVAIWGLNFSIAKIAVSGFNPFFLTFWRVTGAAVLLYLIFRPRIRFSAAVFFLSLTGIVMNQTFFLTGLNLSSPARTALIVSSNSIIVRIIETFVLRKLPSFKELTGFLLAFTGLLILELPGISGLSARALLGDLLVFIAAFSFALYQFFSKNQLKEKGSGKLLAEVMIWAAIAFLPFTIFSFIKTDFNRIPLSTYLGLAYMIVFTSVVAYLLLYYGLKRLPASRVAVFTFLQPVLATFFAVSLGLDRLSLRLIISLLFVLSGIILVERAGEKVRS